MLKGTLIGSNFVEKYFLCSKFFCSKVKFTIVCYSNFSLGNALTLCVYKKQLVFDI